MLTFNSRKYRKNNKGSHKGSGLMDSVVSAITGNTMKKVAEEVSKKALTDMGNRAAEKVVDRIIPKNRSVLDKHLNKEDSYTQYDRYKRGEVIDVKDLFRKK